MLRMRFAKKVGKTTYGFEVEGQNLFEVIMESQKLNFRNVTKCGKCGNEALYLYAYETKEDKYRYVKIICSKCRASVTFGRPKTAEDTYYLRRNEDKSLQWESYKGKQEAQKPEEPKQETESYEEVAWDE